MMRGAPVDMDGGEPLGYADAVGAVADLADVQDLQAQLAQEHPGATLDDVDVEALERQLSPAAVRDLTQLRQLEAELERQGYLHRDEHGATALTPKALRRLGETALRRIFAELSQAVAATTTTGAPVPPTSEPARPCRGSSATSARWTR
jgi:uncharacterized protein with von Willebrand factor type A (vWA) domain